MHADIYGNGRPGLIDEFQRFAATMETRIETREIERDKQHKSNQARLNLIIALLAMIAAYIAIIITLRPWKTIAAFHTTLPTTYMTGR